MHSAQSALEHAVRSDPAVDRLLQSLVFKMSRGSKDPGSFSRAVSNSHKLAGKWSAKKLEKVSQVAELAGVMIKAHYAKQRFDSILTAVRRIAIDLDIVRDFLLDLAVTGGEDHGPWARGLLSAACLLIGLREMPLLHDAAASELHGQSEVFTEENVRLLALLAEFLSIASPFVHSYDRGATRSSPEATSCATVISNVARSSRLIGRLTEDTIDYHASHSHSTGIIYRRSCQDLNKMFSYRALDDKPQIPMCLHADYQHGYVAITDKLMRSSTDQCVVSDGRLLYSMTGHVVVSLSWQCPV